MKKRSKIIITGLVKKCFFFNEQYFIQRFIVAKILWKHRVYYLANIYIDFLIFDYQFSKLIQLIIIFLKHYMLTSYTFTVSCLFIFCA